MKYRLITATFVEEPKRFWRKLYVREDLNLEELGCILVTSLHGAFAHEFMFHTKDTSYMPLSFLACDVNYKDTYMGDHKIKDVESKLKFTYDTGDGWDFNIDIGKVSKEIDSIDYVIYESGAGRGIWEDNIFGLYQYFEGKLKPNSKRRGEDDWRFPWNLDIKTFGQWEIMDDDYFNNLNEYAIDDLTLYQKNELEFKKQALNNLKLIK